MSVYDSDKKEKHSLLDRADDDLHKITGINPEQEEAMEREAYSGAADDIAKREAGESPEGKAGPSRGEQQEADELADKTDSDDDENEDEGFYRPDEPKRKGWRGKITKKRAAIGGAGVLGLFGVGSILLLSTTALPFLHMQSLLRDFHTETNENFSDNRVSNSWNYLRGRGERTNLGALRNRYVDKLETRLANRGITVQYSGNKISSMTIDTSIPKNLDIVNELKAKSYSFSGGPVDVTWNAGRGVGSTGPIRSYFDDFRIAQGESKIFGAIGHRLLKARGGVGLHPFRNFTRNVGESLWDYIRSVRHTSVERARLGDPDMARIPAPDREAFLNRLASAVNDRLPPEYRADTPDAIAKKIRYGIYGVAGFAGVAGLLCSIDQAGDTIVAQHFTEVIEPLIRLGQEGISFGSQAQFADGINSEEIGALFTKFAGETDIGTLSAFSADSIQAELGNEPIGTTTATQGPRVGEQVKPADLSPSTRPGKDKPLFFGFVDDLIGALHFDRTLPLVPVSVCGLITASTFGGWVSVGDAIDVIIAGLTGSGSAVITSILSNALWAAGGFAAGDWIEDALFALGGSALRCDAGGPKEFGSCSNFGARLAANYVALSSGGRELEPQEEIALDYDRLERKIADNKTKSLYARYMDPVNTDSLFTKTALLNPRFSLSNNNLAYALKSPLSSFSNIFSNFGGILSPKAKAATVNYEYGFPEFGFSREEMNDDRFKNPHNNAEWIETRLSRREQRELRCGPLRLSCLNKWYGIDDEDEACFNIYIDDDDGSILNTHYLDYREIIKKPKCKNGTGRWGKNGLERLRMYIKDMVSLKSAYCYESKEGEDDGSCSELGFEEGSTSSDDSAGGADIVGDPFAPSVDVECPEGTEDLGTDYPGYVDGEEIPTRLCAITNLPADEDAVPGANGKAVTNSRVAGAVFAMAEDGPNLSVVSSFRTMEKQQYLWDRAVDRGDCPGSDCGVAEPGFSNHQNGTAIDFAVDPSNAYDAVDNRRTCEDRMTYDGSPGWEWLFENAENYGYTQLSYEAWHWDPATGPKKCNSSQP